MVKPRKKAKAEAPKPRALNNATLMHLLYHPEAHRIRANVQQDVTIGSETGRHGRDIDIALDDLSADIRKQLEAAFKGVASLLGAHPYEESV